MITEEQVTVLLKAFYPRAYAPCEEEIELMGQALEVYEQSKWVSVNDRLPELDVYVLVRYADGSCGISHVKKWNTISVWADSIWVDNENVTHWQPLPEFKES